MKTQAVASQSERLAAASVFMATTIDENSIAGGRHVIQGRQLKRFTGGKPTLGRQNYES